ncbi:MAG TPA: NAD-dependent succinate-semialdehyde dehydrogenase, partial [Solirubrobacteraceae bacterium]|nr:NAD-dependent succinate-semialdehyde dehydrogenase [Solirubrobacteraceae bacterium]
MSDERAVLDAVPKQLYVGGAWRDGAGGETLDVEDPATGETIAAVADGTPQDALDALAAAHDAWYGGWRDSAPRERSDILRRAYEAIMERADDLALLMTLEMGKPLAESKAEISYGASFLRWYAEEAVRLDGRFTMHEAGTGRLLTMKQPVGPCVFITPWNFPLAMGTRKIAPAVAAGCTMVVKPAKLTPLSMLMLAKILEQSGLPHGVLNVVTARSAGSLMEPLIRDPRTRKLSFTGSTEVGRKLMEQAAEQILRVSMELGGNAPFVVFEDADLDAAVEGAIVAKMRNIGEACTAANRFHVAQPIAAEFARRLADRIGTMKIGRGTDEGVEVGPLIDAEQLDKVAELVDDAIGRGARALCGGERVEGAGSFYHPTVLVDVPRDARMLEEEIFGPVAPVTTFFSEDEAIAAANATPFGLVS